MSNMLDQITGYDPIQCPECDGKLFHHMGEIMCEDCGLTYAEEIRTTYRKEVTN